MPTPSDSSVKNSAPQSAPSRRRATRWLFVLGLSVVAVALIATTRIKDLSAAETKTSVTEAATEPAMADRTAELYYRYLEGTLDTALAAATSDAEEQQRLREQLHAVYETRDYSPAWIDDGPILQRARNLNGLLSAEHKHGLSSSRFATDELASQIKLLELQRRPPVSEQMALETRLTLTLLQFTHDLHRGYVDDVELEDWHKAPVPSDIVGFVTEAMFAADRRQLESRLEPTHEPYRQLAARVLEYRQKVDDGGWPAVPAPADGEVIEPGAAVPETMWTALVERLRAEGDLPDDALLIERLYDGAVVTGLEAFQARHGLAVDGKLGPNTLDALNVSAADRLRQIEANLERWRWLPDELPADRIMVNVPAFELKAYRDHEVELTMAIAVGKPGWATPIFEDEVIYAQVNPYWNLPASIAKKSVLPKVRRNPDYLAEENIQVLPGWGQDQDAGSRAELDWNDPGIYGRDYRLRQAPGPQNALGQIKFMFPNEHNIYLHDTPAQRAFEKPNRAVSHGCVRVADPEALADFLFDGRRLETVQTKLDSGVRKRVNLEEPMPVILHYWTAFVEEDGRLAFRDDIYGIDDGVARLLEDALDEPLVQEPSSPAAAATDDGDLPVQRTTDRTAALATSAP